MFVHRYITAHAKTHMEDTTTHRYPPPPPPPPQHPHTQTQPQPSPTDTRLYKHSAPCHPLLTGELQSEALLAGEEVGGELQADGVKGAVGVRGQCGAAQLPQQHPSFLGPVPDPQHVVDLLRVEDQEVQAEESTKHIHSSTDIQGI